MGQISPPPSLPRKCFITATETRTRTPPPQLKTAVVDLLDMSAFDHLYTSYEVKVERRFRGTERRPLFPCMQVR